LKRPPLTLALLSLGCCLAVVLCAALALFIIQFPRCASVPPAPSRETMSAPADSETSACRSQIPAIDPYDLARRLKHSQVLGPLTPTSPIKYSVGDQETFWALNLDPAESFQLTATLAHVSPHLYVWVQDGVYIQEDALEESGQVFEERLYATVRERFGSECTPGINNDVRLTVLNVRFSGAVAYFSSRDQCLSTVIPTSNQREMIYINPEAIQPGSASYNATLAHEFQHMIHWFADPNEDTWVNEGASELAVHLCNYHQSDRINAFARHPDTPLTRWTSDPGDMAAHYGASFLFLAYFDERLGPEATRELVSSELNGIAGFASVLETRQTSLSFEGLFADWVLANYLDGRSTLAADTPYTYEGLDVKVQAERVVTSYPAQGSGTVHQYAADYIELAPVSEDVCVVFTGTATTRVVPNQPHSGRHQWWSNRGDNSDMTLTRSFDLSGLRKATLEAWLWYDIEKGWDYAYVEASADGGETWHILPGRHTTTSNPTGNSYGLGYTGTSGANSVSTGSAEWIQETFDLSPFAGHPVFIRFEYLTDDTFNGAGLCVDDIRVPELGYSHDAETDDDGWEARGFVRCENELPQRYVIQVIRLSDRITGERLVLPEEGTGELVIQGFDEHEGKAILVVSAVTPGSMEAAHYCYEIRRFN